MEEDDKNIEDLVLIELLRLNAVILGLTVGLLSGLTIFILTIILVIKGGQVVGPHLSLLSQFFPGYRVTPAGSIIGFLYGLVFGFLAGYVFARIYNWVAEFRERKRSTG
jgi:hypothetical protein